MDGLAPFTICLQGDAEDSRWRNETKKLTATITLRRHMNRAMRSELEARVISLLELYVTPTLRPLGFRKTGSTYRAVRPTLSWLVNVQRSLWSDSERAELTLNVGVFVSGVLTTYANRRETVKPGIEDCCLSARIGLLSDDGCDVWWKLSTELGGPTNEEIGADIVTRLERDGLPFLSRFGSRDDVVDFLKTPIEQDARSRWISPRHPAQRYAYAATLFARAGNVEDARALLRAAEKAATGSPLESAVAGLREKLDL